MHHLAFILLTFLVVRPAIAATLRVPQDHETIQAAIDSSRSGDIVLVAPGLYPEQLRLTPGIFVRSDGDDTQGTRGLQRAEVTIIEGDSKLGDQPGVTMAAGSTLDGFTITNVGAYNNDLWEKHFDSKGEDLADEDGSVQAEGTRPAVSIRGVSCTVTNCIVHHNGDVGIGVLGGVDATEPLISGNLVYRNMGGGIGVAEGAKPIIRGNTCKENLRAGIGCRQANPIVTNNTCSQNIRAGIGCREGSKPLLRGNKCFENRRAGIGIRMEGTAPIVEDNECFENEMAGIGCRDGATPILRNNLCAKNKMAGIGCRDGAQPLIVGNECRHNGLAGIGVQNESSATIHGNRCIDNLLVAIGITGQSSAMITENELSRVGGVPPMIAVKDDSNVTIRDNRVSGGGVAAILIQGRATIIGNTLTGLDAKQGNAVWVWEDSRVTIADNFIHGYRTAVNSRKATVTISGNAVTQFQTAAFIVRDSRTAAHVYGNSAVSSDPKAKVVELTGASGIVERNVLNEEEAKQ